VCLVTGEADEIVEAIRQAVEAERRKKQAESLHQTHEAGMFGAINCPKQSNEENKARTKIAQTFNTNRTYVNEAAKLSLPCKLGSGTPYSVGNKELPTM
jgi:hypothetical protein